MKALIVLALGAFGFAAGWVCFANYGRTDWKDDLG